MMEFGRNFAGSVRGRQDFLGEKHRFLPSDSLDPRSVEDRGR
jgi:hypothetical protein